MPRLLWTQKEDIGPAPRTDLSMTYDGARRRMVLVNGVAHVLNDPYRGMVFPLDTWEWDGTSWVQTADSGPPGRRWHGLAYDAKRERVVLFGGIGGNDVFSDTWEWDGEYWTQVADSGPAPRYLMPMTFDRGRGRVVLFGGVGWDGKQSPTYGDTWEWDGNEWTQQQDSGPGARYGHAMAYDAARAVTVLFGGAVLTMKAVPPATIVGDTWERGVGGWVQRSDMGPPPSVGHSMVYNTRGVILFGGASSHDSPAKRFQATWEWTGKLWIERQDMGPAARLDAAMSYDTDRDRIVLFGGDAGPLSYFGDTWELVDNQPPP
jgi:hypothetical protein